MKSARAITAVALGLVAPGLGHFAAGRIPSAVRFALGVPAVGASITLGTALGLLAPSLFVGLALGLPLLVQGLGALDAGRLVRRDERDLQLGVTMLGFAAVSIGLTFGTIGLLEANVMSMRRISSATMAPELLVGDYVLVRRGRYAQAPARGDVLEFEFPRDRRFTYVQRVIATEGEVVVVRSNVPVVNGAAFDWGSGERGEWRGADCSLRRAPLHEERLPGGLAYQVLNGPTEAPPAPVTLAEGELYMLGDNRSASDDSRRWGALTVGDVSGSVFAVGLSFDPCTRWLRFERHGPLRSLAASEES